MNSEEVKIGNPLKRIADFWWRRRELNPRPKTHPSELLRAQTVILASAVSLGHRQAVTRCGFGSFMMHGAGKAYRAHVLHSSTPHPRPWTSGVERSLLKQRQEQRNRCSLIYKMPVLWMSGASARYSDFRVPVETGTPPCFLKWPEAISKKGDCRFAARTAPEGPHTPQT